MLSTKHVGWRSGVTTPTLIKRITMSSPVIYTSPKRIYPASTVAGMDNSKRNPGRMNSYSRSPGRSPKSDRTAARVARQRREANFQNASLIPPGIPQYHSIIDPYMQKFYASSPPARKHLEHSNVVNDHHRSMLREDGATFHSTVAKSRSMKSPSISDVGGYKRDFSPPRAARSPSAAAGLNALLPDTPSRKASPPLQQKQLKHRGAARTSPEGRRLNTAGQQQPASLIGPEARGVVRGRFTHWIDSVTTPHTSIKNAPTSVIPLRDRGIHSASTALSPNCLSRTTCDVANLYERHGGNMYKY